MAVAFMAEVAKIRPHPKNPRKQLRDIDELAASMREHGLVQPIVVVPDLDRPDGHFLLTAGERRWTAAKALGWTRIPANLRNVRRSAGDGDEIRSREIELMLVENLQRNALTPLETAHAVEEIRISHDPPLTHAAIARRLGKSQSWVTQILYLLELDDVEQEELATGDMGVGEAKELGQERRRVRLGRTSQKGKNTGWHLSRLHPLSVYAKVTCDLHGHDPSARRLGNVACGACWETIIRADERGNVAVVITSARDTADVDRVIIDQLQLRGGMAASPAERFEAFAALLGNGKDPEEAGRRLGYSPPYAAQLAAVVASLTTVEVPS